MKKIISIISALAIMAGALVFSGCNPNLALAPEDEWCVKDYSYEISEGNEVNLSVYFYYATADKEVTLGYKTEGETTKPNPATLKKGLNIVLVGKPSSSNETTDAIFGAVTAGKTPLYLYTMSEGNSVNVENAEGETTSFNMSNTTWNLIYLFNAMDDQDFKPAFTKESGESSYKNYQPIENLTETFSMEKLLKQITLNCLTKLLS